MHLKELKHYIWTPLDVSGDHAQIFNLLTIDKDIYENAIYGIKVVYTWYTENEVVGRVTKHFFLYMTCNLYMEVCVICHTYSLFNGTFLLFLIKISIYFTYQLQFPFPPFLLFPSLISLLHSPIQSSSISIQKGEGLQ